MFDVQNVTKSFCLHHQGGAELTVLNNVSFKVSAGECVALVGPSGAGKSTMLRMLYGNYLLQKGAISIGNTSIGSATPRHILAMRNCKLGYVSQFLRVLPRVSTLKVVCEPMIKAGLLSKDAEVRARNLLSQLRIPESLWELSPLTFSGGEQQRVNIARGMGPAYPGLLLDEPTASLDPENRETVLNLVKGARDQGAAIIGIFHDKMARDLVCDREIDLTDLSGSVDHG